MGYFFGEVTSSGLNAKTKPVGSLMSTLKDGNEFLLAKCLNFSENLKVGEEASKNKKKDGEETQYGDDEEAKTRNLLDDSATTKVKSQSYKTYRSCVPSADEEKLSVLGFEAIILGLLQMTGTAINRSYRCLVC